MKLRDALKLSRRALLMAALPALPAASAGSAIPVVRYYTATATVSFLGIKLVVRKAAASGFARAETIDGTTILEFGAGFQPRTYLRVLFEQAPPSSMPRFARSSGPPDPTLFVTREKQ